MLEGTAAWVNSERTGPGKFSGREARVTVSSSAERPALPDWERVEIPSWFPGRVTSAATTSSGKEATSIGALNPVIPEARRTAASGSSSFHRLEEGALHPEQESEAKKRVLGSAALGPRPVTAVTAPGVGSRTNSIKSEGSPPTIEISAAPLLTA